jgi:hypothetical protein
LKHLNATVHLQATQAIRDDEDEDEDMRQEDPQSPADADADADADGDARMGGFEHRDETSYLIKNLVRYALACEYSRTPIRRDGIREKGMHDDAIIGCRTPR